MATELSEDAPRKPTSAAHWHEQLQLAARVERDWRQEAECIVERYADEGRRSGTRLNILASTMQLLQPSVFARAPRPSVRRRHMLEDPNISALGRQAAVGLERVLSYLQDTTAFEQQMHRVALDMLLTGRGVGRVTYDAEILRRTDLLRVMDPLAGAVWLLDGQPTLPEFDAKGGAYVEQKVSESVEFSHVFYADFRCEPARCWADVQWVAFRHVMGRRELREEFGADAARSIPLTIGATQGEPYSLTDPDTKAPADPPSKRSKAVVWEVWSKPDRERLWIAEGHDHIIRTDADPLTLEGFFPCAEPVRHIYTTDALTPIPEFRLWKDQADELDRIQSRITHLIEVARAVLIVDGDLSEVIKVSTAIDGEAIPIERPGEMAGDLANAIFQWPIDRVVQTITVLSQRAEQLKAQIFEISGVSDIMRGSVAERESAAASKMKVGFGRVRQTPRSAPMARFVRDTLRIMGEVVAEQFDPATIARTAGVQMAPEVVQLLREEKLRGSVLEISDQDMVAEDRELEKVESQEFMQAAAAYLQALLPVAQALPAMAPLLMEMLKQSLKAFKFARGLEDLIDQTTMAVAQQAQQAQQMQQMQAMAPQQMGMVAQ